jgi:uncharacterized protein
VRATGQRPQVERLNFYDKPFWDGCREGKFVLQTCAACGYINFPGGPICPRCWSRDLGWRALSGEGLVYSWIRMHRQYFEEMQPPYSCVLVELSEGPFFVTNFELDGSGRDPVIGEPVSLRIVEFENTSLPIAFPVDSAEGS